MLSLILITWNLPSFGSSVSYLYVSWLQFLLIAFFSLILILITKSFWFEWAASADVGFAIYDRYSRNPSDHFNDQQHSTISYVAHLAGALAGLTIGLVVLKNFEQKLHEQLIWWVALGVYTASVLFAIIHNVYSWERTCYVRIKFSIVMSDGIALDYNNSITYWPSQDMKKYPKKKI